MSFEMVYGTSDKTSIQTLSSSDMHDSGQYFTDEPEFEEKHEGKTGVARTSFNVLCLVVGAGILNLPAALELSGWFGVIPLFMFAFFAAYTAILISKCMRPPDGPGLRTYAEIGYKAFGKWGQVLSDIMVHSNLVGAGISYLILCGQNLSFLLQNFPLTSGNYSLWDLSAAGGMSITAILLWFHVFFETMHEISIVSFFNLMVAVILTVVVIAEIFANPITGTVETKFFTNFLNVGGAMSSMAYAYGAHAALPTVHDAMKDKNKFPLMIIISYCIIILFYVPLSIIGYNAYGCDTMSPIYDNLCSSIEANCNWIEAFGKYSSIFLVTVHVFLAYMLNINPTEIAIEKLLKVETRKEPFIWRVINRSIIVIFTLILAEVIPSFQDFIGLVGSISTTFTIFVMPPLFYMKIYHGRIGIVSYIIAGLTILIGIYVGLFGTYHAVQSIICLFGDYSFCAPVGCS